MATLTRFQEKKISRVFSVLYDTNNDGIIEEKDFQLYLEKICGILGWKENGEKYTKAKTTLDTVWKGLLEYADTNKDAKVSKEEWLKMWCDCLNDLKQNKFPTWQKMYMDLMFEVNDKSNDNVIDVDEYTAFFSEFGVSQSDCKKAFDELSKGTNINREAFEQHWRDYLTSNEPATAGNYLFGPPELV